MIQPPPCFTVGIDLWVMNDVGFTSNMSLEIMMQKVKKIHMVWKYLRKSLEQAQPWLIKDKKRLSGGWPITFERSKVQSVNLSMELSLLNSAEVGTWKCFISPLQSSVVTNGDVSLKN